MDFHFWVFGELASPEAVVTLGLAAFQRNRPSVVHGLRNWLTALSSRFFSRAFVVRLTASLLRPKAPALTTTVTPSP